MRTERPEVPLEAPQAALERAIIDDYLRARGHSLRSLRTLPADQVRAILRDAALHAATLLAEHEARAQYVHEIHGVVEPGGKPPKSRT